MKKIAVLLLLVAMVSGMAVAQAPAAPPAPKTPGEAMGLALGLFEKWVMGAADAMPDDKYNFKPTGGEYGDVRTYGEEFRHIAYANYMFGSLLKGEKNPLGVSKDGNGPDLKTKAEIIKQLKESYAYLHEALNGVTSANEMELVDFFGMKVPKATIAAAAVAHPLDHYGQSVEYLRMNGIVPPASRPKPPKKD